MQYFPAISGIIEENLRELCLPMRKIVPRPLIKLLVFDLLVLFLLIILVGPLSVPAHGQAQPQVDLTGKKVLVLHSYEANVPAFVGTDKGLTTSLESNGISNLNQFFESLDMRRYPVPEHRKLLLEQMRVRYGHQKLDMIITMFPEALEFVLKDGRDIFPDVPILALYLPEGFELPETDRRIIGHSAKTDIIGTLEIGLKLVPGARRVYVVSGAHEVDRMIEDRARRELNKWETRLEFHYLSHMSFEDMLATISTVPPDSIILALVVSRDVTGRNYTSVEVAKRLSQVSPAPIFGLLDAALGHGSAGGSLINFERIGTKAGELVLDILRGTPTPNNIPESLDVPPVPMFDWRQLRHWNLSERVLPKGSIVINKKLTIWDFKYYIIGGLALCLVQSLLIAGLLLQRRRKVVAEESLQQKTEELDQFFNVALDLLGIANTDGYFLRLNPAVERILGYTREELMAQQFFDFIHPDDVDRTREAVSALGSQQKLLLFENRYRCKDGTYRWLEWSAVPTGDLIYTAARDVTERKRAEGEVARARAELLRVQRLTHLNELTASLSHELNQPLAAILSSAQAALRFLQSATPDLNLFRTILQNIVEDDKRAADVIRSLRSLVKKEAKEKEPLNINEVLSDVLPLFRSESILRNVEIKTDFDNSLPPVRGDRIQLQQVMLNLIMNATEAMSQIPPQQRMIILRTHATGDNIQVTVRDFGPGIDCVKLNDIWQPFFTTKSGGLGIGLSICTSIIQTHRGRIWAENNPDGGATFVFELPMMINGNP